MSSPDARPRDLTKAEKKKMFTNESQTIINWAGDNFYKSCDVLVHEKADGGASYCVKPVNHGSKLHEDFAGQTMLDLDASALPEVTHEATQ